MLETIDRRALLKGAMGTAALVGTGAFAGSALAAEAPKNRICELLGIEKPVFSAPMYALTTGEFVAAVSNAGGCGILNASTLSTENAFPEADEVLALAEQHFQAIVDNTDKPWGVSLPYSDCPGILDLVLDYHPTCVIPSKLTPAEIDELREEGIKIIGSAYDADPEVLRAMSAECDLIYLKCYGCGGSIPHSRANPIALMSKFANQGIEAPIVIGGGIVNAASAAAIAAAGAEGAWVGTRFLASEESPMHPDAKQALVDLKAADMIELEFGFSYSHCNPSPKALELRERYWAGEDAQALATESYNMYLYGMRLGQLDDWMLSVDDSVDAITEILTCQQIVDEIGDAILDTQAKMA